MGKKWNLAKFAAIISVLFLIPLCFSETTGNISLSDANQRIVTGLWGITASTTTTTVNYTATTTTVSILTGTGTGTGSGNTTTTTRITTTTARGATTSTAGNGTAGTATTTTLTSFKKENLERAMTSEQVTLFIQNNSALKSAIETHVGSIASSVNPEASKELSENIWVMKILETGDNFSRLILNVTYNGEKPMQNVIIFDKISKTFAENADLITIETNVQNYVVEQDPSFIFIAPEMQKNDIILIQYSVNQKIGNAIIDDGETLLFSGGYKQAQASTFMWIAIIAFIISLISIFALIFRNQIMALIFPEKGRKKYGKKIGFGETLKNAVENIKKKIREKMLRKKEEPKFYYEHEEQAQGKNS